MRLRSVRIECYRVHRALALAFEPGITVVTGPNESGKSTVVEALHRVLFWRAKGGSEEIRAMGSVHGGTPLVSLAFETQGKECRITKAFGKAGTTRLEVAGEPVRTGDEAEERLAELVPGAPSSDLQRRKDAGAAWGHLWVWQGTSAADPLDAVGSERGRLIQRLQALEGTGAAALVASQRDYVAHRRVKAALAELIGANGKPRKDSPLARAEQELRDAEATLAGLAESRAKTADMERELEVSLALAASTREIVKELEARAAATEIGMQHVESLEKELEEPRRELARTESEAHALAATQREIAHLEAELGRLESERARTRFALSEAKRLVGEIDASAQAEATHRNTAEERLATSEPVVAALEAHAEALRAKAEARDLEERSASVEGERERARTLGAAVAAFGDLTPKRLAELRRLHERVRQSDAECSARALWIEVLAGGQPVTAAGVELRPDQVTRFTATTLLVTADGTRIRITPGSAADLASALEARELANRELEKALAALGIPDLESAEARATERESLARELDTVRALVARLGAPTLAQDLETARQRAAETAARAARLATGSGLELPATLAEAERDRVSARRDLERLRADVELARRSHEALRSELDRARADERTCQEAASRLDRQADPLRGKLEMLLHKHGDAAHRGEDEARIVAKLATLRSKVAGLADKLSALDPQTLRSDRERCAAALVLRRAEAARAELRSAELKATLGAENHGESLEARHAVALAHRERCEQAHARARLQLEARSLLAREFDTAAAEVADRFKRPLEAAITGYLCAAFGGAASVSLAWDTEAGTFGDFVHSIVDRRSADLGTFAFESLSRGAQEQVAIAVRLAVAEVLAPDFGGALPIVLDDALTHSDPERVRGMHRLLERATKRGVQVLVFTCAPRDYAALPTAQVPIAAPRGTAQIGLATEEPST